MYDDEGTRREPPEWLDAPPPVGLFDAPAHPDETAAGLAAAVPGPNGAAALSGLDPARLSDAGRVDLIVAANRQIAAWQAVQLRALASLAEHAGEPDRDGGNAAERLRFGWVREDVACALQLGPVQAGDLLRAAAELDTRLGATLDALAAGGISYRQATTLADAVAGSAR